MTNSLNHPFGEQERHDALADLADEDQSAPANNEIALKVRENRLRRMAERQGLRLEKSRRRDPRATDFGTFQLIQASNGTIAAYGAQSGYGLSLDEVEQYLTA